MIYIITINLPSLWSSPLLQILFQNMHEFPSPKKIITVDPNRIKLLLLRDNITILLNQDNIRKIRLPVEQISITANTKTRLQIVQGFLSIKNPKRYNTKKEIFILSTSFCQLTFTNNIYIYIGDFVFMVIL